MKGITGIVFVAGLLAGTALQAQDTAAQKNPAVEKFAKAIVFYASMDGTANAELSPGDGKPNVAPPAAVFVPGLYGKAIQSGDFDLSYVIPKSARTTRTGAAAVWVARAPNAKQDSSYFVFLSIMGNGRLIWLARMGDPLNKEILYAWIGTPAGTNGTCVVTGGRTLDWKEREWHLLVANWTSDTVALSVDGEAPGETSLQNGPPEPPADKFGDERLIVSSQVKKKDADAFLLNEVMLFNAPLTAQEIKSLYETSKKK